jgi:hypothetical protein
MPLPIASGVIPNIASDLEVIAPDQPLNRKRQTNA